MLRGALTRVRQEREPELVTLVGVPGIGKSRIVAELFSIVDDDPDIIVWRQGRCLPYGEGISYWALGEMAKSQAGILETRRSGRGRAEAHRGGGGLVPDARRRRSGSRPTCGRSSGSARSWAPGATAVARRSPPGGASSSRSASSGRRCSSSRICTGPTTGCSTSWTASSTAPRACRCSSSAAPGPSCSSAARAGEAARRTPSTLSLSALSDEDTARLIAEHLAQAVLPAEMQQTLLRRADGNPLFAEEYIRMLRDRGLLRREGGSWRLDSADVDVPRPCRGSSPPGSTPWSRTRRRSCRPRPSWGRSSGSARSRRSPGSRRGRRRSGCTRSSARSSSAATAAPRWRGRRSTRCATCSCATSPTARSRACAAPTCTCARRGGSSRSARTGRRTGPRCWPTTTSLRWS